MTNSEGLGIDFVLEWRALHGIHGDLEPYIYKTSSNFKFYMVQRRFFVKLTPLSPPSTKQNKICLFLSDVSIARGQQVFTPTLNSI